METRLDFLGGGCNRIPGCAAWSSGTNSETNDGSLIAYASGRNVILYDPNKSNVVGSLQGHTDRINSIRWLPNSKGGREWWSVQEEELISVSSDKTIRIWRSENGIWRNVLTHEGHTGPVTSVAAINYETSHMIATCSADCTLKIWTRSDKELKLVDSFDFKPKMIESIAFSYVPDGATNDKGNPIPLLAAGGVDTLIHIYLQLNSGKFVKLFSVGGHQDWIRSLSFSIPTAATPELFLASGAQDSKIRIWKISKPDSTSELESSKNEKQTNTNEISTSTMSSKGHSFKLSNGIKYVFILESVLSDHEEWVNSVCWQPPAKVNGVWTQPMSILSSSIDKKIFVWRYSNQSKLWMSDVSVGVVGGNMPGFYGAVFGPNANSIIGYTYIGSFHMWIRRVNNENEEDWEPQIIPSGHYGSVNELAWEPTKGHFLVSVSSDQTTRLFAPWNTKTKTITNTNKNENNEHSSWHEISRVQVHGHDLNSVCFTKTFELATGADEKVIRVFEAPETFVQTLESLSGTKLDWTPTLTFQNVSASESLESELGISLEELEMMGDEEGGGKRQNNKKKQNQQQQQKGSKKQGNKNENNNNENKEEETTEKESKKEEKKEEKKKVVVESQTKPNAKPLGANVPSLGLSNKPVFDTSAKMESTSEQMDAAPPPIPIVHQKPPFEEHLIQSTLWPESHKLYGHPNEIVSVASNRSGSLLVSSCKAQKPEQSAIRFWNTTTWKQVAQAQPHTLTVVQMEFSNNDDLMVSVSRDRQLAVMSVKQTKTTDGNVEVKIDILQRVKAHERIIWGITWAPDDSFFMTASRDKTVRIWARKEGSTNFETVATLPEFEAGATAVAVTFDPRDPKKNSYVLATGLENGKVSLWSISKSFEVQPLLPLVSLPNIISSTTCGDEVSRLRWRPNSEQLTLAVSSLDNAVRIFSFNFRKQQ